MRIDGAESSHVSTALHDRWRLTSRHYCVSLLNVLGCLEISYNIKYS